MENIQIMEGYPAHIQERLTGRELFRQTFPGTINGHAPALVFEDLKLWQVGTLKVSFKGGEAGLHKAIADTAKQWSRFANIRFDFGDEEQQLYRAWTPDDDSHIRIGFEFEGYWSVVGTDSQDRSILNKGEISLNLSGFDQRLPTNWQGIVLHEFGHAIGFHHEHATPDIECDFDWDRIYEFLGGPPNNWSKEKVDFNLRQMSKKFVTWGPHDNRSIMHYAFPQWMFKNGGDSPCFTQNNNTLSEEDKRMAGKAYPFSKAAFANQLIMRKESLQDLLAMHHGNGEGGREHFEKHLAYLNNDKSYRAFFPTSSVNA